MGLTAFRIPADICRDLRHVPDILHAGTDLRLVRGGEKEQLQDSRHSRHRGAKQGQLLPYSELQSHRRYAMAAGGVHRKHNGVFPVLCALCKIVAFRIPDAPTWCLGHGLLDLL